MQPVELLTVKGKVQLYKGDEPANAIELIQLEEVGFEIISQKDLYQVGDKAVYIQPDYCLSDIPLFESFLRPGGDPKKSKLGSKNRIRSVKFNLHKGDGDPIYSQGVLLPVNEVLEYLHSLPLYNDYDRYALPITSAEALGIVKWEEPDDNSGSGIKSGKSKPFPEGMYKTDEENINNLWNKIQYPITLMGTEKIDGSSITLYVKDGKPGICSRNLDKPLKTRSVVGRRKTSWFEKIKLVFGMKIDLNIYDEVDSDSDFVKYGKPYLEKLIEFYNKENVHATGIALRGELNGQTLKGSGNKNNPSVKDKPNIKFFGADVYGENKHYNKLPDNEFRNLLKDLGLQDSICKVVFNNSTFNSREEIEQACSTYFKKNMIEGLVLRTMDSKFSAKFMNPEYDSKK